MEIVGVLDHVCISLLREAFLEVGGCEGSVWLADKDEKNLVAVYNSGEDAASLVGFEQPVGSGIISMVFVQQQPYCENDIGTSHGHDDTLDKKIEKSNVYNNVSDQFKLEQTEDLILENLSENIGDIIISSIINLDDN